MLKSFENNLQSNESAAVHLIVEYPETFSSKEKHIMQTVQLSWFRWDSPNHRQASWSVW